MLEYCIRRNVNNLKEVDELPIPIIHTIIISVRDSVVLFWVY